MLPLYLCNSLPVIKNSDSVPEFKGSSDIHQESVGFGLKKELLSSEGWKQDPVIQSTVRLVVCVWAQNMLKVSRFSR